MDDLWDKLHALGCDLENFLQERDSKPEVVQSKHAWDMILMHIHREVKECREMVRIKQCLEKNANKYQSKQEQRKEQNNEKSNT